MHKLIMQKSLDFVAKKLNNQGCKSINEDNYHCLYRSKKGRKCSIGHMIPDYLYNKDMENRSIVAWVEAKSFLRDNKFVLWASSEENFDFLCLLQRAHDASHSSDDVNDYLSEIAQQYGLRIPINVKKFN